MTKRHDRIVGVIKKNLPEACKIELAMGISANKKQIEEEIKSLATALEQEFKLDGGKYDFRITGISENGYLRPEGFPFGWEWTDINKWLRDYAEGKEVCISTKFPQALVAAQEKGEI